MNPALVHSQHSPRHQGTSDREAAENVQRSARLTRRFPVGAELLHGGTHFRVWAPRSDQVFVELLVEGASVAMHPLDPETKGYHSALVPAVSAGARYRYRLPQGAFPDPASRFQPEGPHGPSEVVDPRFEWTDSSWRGRPTQELVIYEMHLGTFTAEGTWHAAEGELPELARIGITAIEIMPIADFPGRYGWGYDGVDLYAPCRLYGRPDDARSFVNRAHALGISVILDVVYNHLGPDGCYLREFSPDYFSQRYECEWGDPLNFDGDNAGPVREFYVSNARYWIDEFHFDGLRLDATQQIFDASAVHIITEVTAAARQASPGRQIFVVAENEPQLAVLLRSPEAGGYGVDAIWNDDFHHAARVAATGHAEAYFGDYRGSPQEFISACKHGFLFQGQFSRWQQKRRGSSALDLKPERFVHYLENHDQVANSLRGQRLHELTSPGTLRALTALQLLSPAIPLLFQGQEFAASAPFQYFADHKPELATVVAEGRRRFLRQFRSIAAKEAEGIIPEASAPDTFARCKLDQSERQRHRPIYQLHEDLLRLRRETPVLREPAALDGAVLSAQAFVLRFFGPDNDDRLLIINLGGDLVLNPAPEPLLAPVEKRSWSLAWSSESPAYGGGGTADLETTENWIIRGPAAFLLSPDSDCELPRAFLSEKH